MVQASSLRVLVVGGAGYIGSHMLKCLHQAGCELTTLDNLSGGYADAVRLLLAAAPEVFANDIFAMKGGTAINLFVRDMPRLSVDIDVVYTP